MHEPAVRISAHGAHVMLNRETLLDWRVLNGGAAFVGFGCVEISGWPDDLEAVGRTLIDIAHAAKVALNLNQSRNGDDPCQTLHRSHVVVTPPGPLWPPQLERVQDGGVCHQCNAELGRAGTFCDACLATEDSQHIAAMAGAKS